MIENIQMATKNELLNEMKELESEFNENKFLIQAAYNKMTELSERYTELEEEVNKRGGKINE